MKSIWRGYALNYWRGLCALLPPQDGLDIDAVLADAFEDDIDLVVNIGVAALADGVQTLRQHDGGFLFALAGDFVVDAVADDGLHNDGLLSRLSPLYHVKSFLIPEAGDLPNSGRAPLFVNNITLSKILVNTLTLNF